MAEREFKHGPPVLGYVALKFAFFGPTGSGKTKSALLMAKGIQQVSGGKIFVIDTEISGDTGRASFYKDTVPFEHVVFQPPYNPMSYVAALRHCVNNGAKVIVIDNLSHEHEGIGGVLQMHDDVVEEKGMSHNFLAWGVPKKERNVLIRMIQTCPAHLICCFRAKERIKLPEPGEQDKDKKKVKKLGFMPIGAEEHFYEMLATAMFLPGAEGVPTWNDLEIGEKQMVKTPEFLKPMLINHKGPIAPEFGKRLAEWAHGSSTSKAVKTTAPKETGPSIGDQMAAAPTLVDLGKIWVGLSQEEKSRWQKAKDDCKAKLEETPPSEEDPDSIKDKLAKLNQDDEDRR